MRSIRFTLLASCFLFFTLISKAQVEQKSFDIMLRTMLKESVPTISVAELSKKELDKYVLLDAREYNEYKVSHLKDAVWLGYDTFDATRLKGIPKDAKLIVYCSIGVRSEKIGEKLQALGYPNVQNLYGSIFEWVNQGNTVYDLAGKPTQKVHAYSKTWGIWLNKGEKVY